LKKTIYSALALCAVTTAAQAQTSVTIYGNIDPAVMTQSKSGATGAGGRDTAMVDGSIASSLYGFKGIEDLGGGLSAGFVLEGGFSSINGKHANPGVYQTQLFGREAKITLGGDWGTIGAGLQLDPGLIASISTEPRQDTPSFSNLDFWIHATLGNNYSGGGSLQGGIYDDNALTYTYAKNGLYVGAEYGFGGVAGSTSANSTQSIGISYANGGFTVSGSYVQDKNINPAVDSYSSQISVFGLGYTFSTVAVRVQYGDFKTNPALYTQVADDIQSWGIGIDWKTSVPNKVNLSYYDAKDAGASFGGKTTEIALLDTYSLSKHTFVFAQVADLNVGPNAGLSAGLGGFYVPNGAYASGNTSTLYFGLGVNHTF